jgi:TonB family protein
VAPSKQEKRPEPVRAEVKNPKQTIVSRSPRHEPAKQMTLAPAPELKIQPDLAAPNLMAFEAPKPPEPKPEPKLFMPPAPVERPVDQPVLEEAPEVAVAENRPSPAPLPVLPKPQPKVFTPPPPVLLPWDQPRLENAPAVSIAETRNALAALPIPSIPKPQPKKFTPPTPAARRTEAPQLQPGTAAVIMPPAPSNPRAIAMPSIPGPPKPQPRAFTPPAPAKRAAASAPALESASNLTAAVVGLNPVDREMPVIPEISRSAEFSAAPEISRIGGAEASGEAGRIVIPGLSIRSGEAAPKRESIATIARVAPTSHENVLAAVKPLIASAPASTAATTVTSPIARVGAGPDSRFGGRTVYTVAIQMPNVTSYSGSWILWYAERERLPGEAPQILPPTPLRKVDPIYDLSAVEERIEGKVRLSAVIHTDGYVYGINVLSGIDPRLDKNAITALRKWEFQPARRDGNPVDVDVVIEIPFRLRPPKK